MNRDDIRDRLLLLAECSNQPHKQQPFKRKSLSKQQSSTATQSKSAPHHNQSKLSMQDFVRMDPGYTPDIEHLVFPGRKRNPQQVAPLNPSSSRAAAAAAAQSSKTRSRLAEMFALSRHLQQRSQDREAKMRNPVINRSVDSVLDSRSGAILGSAAKTQSGTKSSALSSSRSGDRRWASSASGGAATVEEPVRQQQQQSNNSSRISPVVDADMATARGPNVSVLHLRSTSEPWETSPTSSSPMFSTSLSSRPKITPPQLTKHQSLGNPSSTAYKWTNSSNFHGEVNSTDFFVGTSNTCSRELSPVRWCDREVDGVYLGRSGWVQVQQRSLDENRRRISYATTSSLLQSKRTGIKLADYHCNSEPGKCPTEPATINKSEAAPRPGYLLLQTRDFERNKRAQPENLSPPSITPIISPPPAFQDQNKSSPKTRTFFGKTPFLPRSNAIVDSDEISPPPTPKPKWKTLQESRRPQENRIPQTKSLEDNTSGSRRSQFLQRYGESSSSSSSSMGFRSLDSCMSTRPAMPRLSENTDSSIDVYEDADEEDNNSSSLNLSIVSSMLTKEKISPSSRQNRMVHRQMKRSPVGSDTNKNNCTSPGSSSTSSNEFATTRRAVPVARPYQASNKPVEDPLVQRVRRSRSLQLPDKNFRDARVSPEAHRVAPKPIKRQSRPEANFTDEDMIREAEVVTGFLYGNRSRAAAQALLMHRYNNNNNEEKPAAKSVSNNGLTVYIVNGKKNKKILHRGMTAEAPNVKNPCNPESCDFWPHCAHRESLNREAQFMMKSSQSYPTHQRSLDSAGTQAAKRPTRIERRPSPNNTLSRPEVVEKRSSPIATNTSNSSSSSDVWLTTSDRTVTKSPKNAKSSEASTPIEDLPDVKCREMILTRPGSAPAEEHRQNVVSSGSAGGFLESQQRSMSLPKSFLSVNSAVSARGHYQQQQQQQQQQGGQFSWRRRGTESLGSSPGLPRKANNGNGSEVSHTAPVTPLHEGSRRRSPLSGAARRVKASSTPQLLETQENRKWIEKSDTNEIRSNPSSKDLARRNIAGGGNTTTAESVLQKFRKTFSLRFHQKKSSKDSCSSDLGDPLAEILGEPSEEESPQHVAVAPPPSASSASNSNTTGGGGKDEQNEQKTRFGPLIWRTSKERKKLNKAARSAKCNSGDSGIQIEMVPGCGGGTGDSSESHDTDPQCDDLDSPPSVRRRHQQQNYNKIANRPHSDLLNQILIDKFKSDLKQRAHKHNQVRRTRSDLGGQRLLLHWDPRSSYRRLMSSPAPMRGRPQSPRKKPPDAPGGVQLRTNHNRRGQLRRSLSQPLDIDKLSPLMRTKTAGLRLGGSHVLSEDEHDNRIGTSDDEAMSDSESSMSSLTERKKSLESAMDEEMIILAEAVFDHVAIEAEELAFRAGDVIEVIETANRDWWWGQTNNKLGWFPAQFVRLRVSQEDTVEDCLAAMASGNGVPSQIRRRTSISLLSNDQVRTSVVRELVHTERDFVKVLQDVAEGYIAECRKRKDMFSDEQIATIFINLEDLLKFQMGFLKDLEMQIDWESPYKSCVGSCFLRHSNGFKMYSEYCNSHPMATAALQELYQFNNYSKFFEACRLMRGLIEIPLDGYLLTPVQRICKYPLQLAELLKYTKPDHCDYNDIKEALDAMRGVAVLINERKRRMESLEKLAAWQQRVEGWEGEDLIEISSQLIHQGEVVRVTTGMWTNNITLFLFDHQIVYCKKDILKRNTFVYKGRFCLDTSEIIDVPDGKDNHLGVSVRHAIKLYSCIRYKWLLFCCRSSSDKQRWLQSFAEERKLVAQDKDDGLEFPPAARQLARVAAVRCQRRRPPRKPRAGKNYKHPTATSYMGSTFQLNSSNSNSLGRKVGTWFTFGANKKSRHQSRDVS